MNSAIYLSSTDTCAILTRDVDKGDGITYISGDSDVNISVRERIPIWHKIAVKQVKKGEKIIKCGAVIGIATEDIAVGEHIHIHNIVSPGGQK